MGVNLKGPFRLSALVGTRMVADGGGSIIFVSSIASQRPTAGELVYGAAKAGVNALTYGLARTLGPTVRVNCIVPGPFLTDRLRSNARAAAAEAGQEVDALLAERAKSSPAGRVGDPAEFGAACVFLCSAQAGFIVGQNLLLDGGAFNATMA